MSLGGVVFLGVGRETLGEAGWCRRPLPRKFQKGVYRISAHMVSYALCQMHTPANTATEPSPL